MFHGSGGWGALQFVGKYDVLDQSDDKSFDLGVNPVSSSFTGACANTRLFPGLSAGADQTISNKRQHSRQVAECGKMKTWVVGVNWWMTDYMRLMFQYSQSDLSGYPTTSISSTPQILLCKAAAPCERLRRRHDQRLRHAHASRLVKLEKRNFSPLRSQTAALKRGGGSF